ncbi:serine/threonine kinase [Fimbriiglobus ruber]|uniref:Serine/threonine kinase n=1 Tax=Fimbriiglobus ruber TaxID=1908690 RepID=A0A225DP29_9BACT|nr:serine/threonine kinase [Fimbriiglobus ruber]
MGANPSSLKDGPRFPVENVSREDCQKFLEKVNARPGTATAFGMKGRFVLPHEDEWEYACRGGKGNQEPFSFGGVLNGKQANCRGDLPYGTETKGPNLSKTSMAGSYEKAYPHPWGLYDMHGNVAEWCDSKRKHDKGNSVVRGGSWVNPGYNCRSASRYEEAPDKRGHNIGFRVAFRPD